MKGQERKKKPAYHMGQNLVFMFRHAWKGHKRVLFFCLGIVWLHLALNLVQLYVAPVILSKVGQRVPLAELLETIVLSSLLLFIGNALKDYAERNVGYGLIDVRSEILMELSYKAGTTAYSNFMDPAVMALQQKCLEACGDNSQATEHIWWTMIEILENAAGFFIYFSLLTRVHWLMVIIILVTAILGFLASQRSQKWDYCHREEGARYQKQLYYLFNKAESVEMAKEIRVFGLAGWLHTVYGKTLKLYDDFVGRRERKYFLADLADVALAFARNGAAYVYLIYMALEEGLPAPEFLLYVTAVNGFGAWVSGLLQALVKLRQEGMDISDIQEYLTLEEPFCFEGGEPLPRQDGGWELRLEHVSFRYPRAEEDTVHDINLTIRAGEKLAVVGLNGAGKTTLVKLLCGFFDPSKGRVLLNGIDIRRLNRREYYRLFSAVFQEFSIPDVTVEEQVAQSAKEHDQERVEKCLELAGLAGTVQELPKGVHTHIGRRVYLDGVMLSGGQIQRLMLARALYKNGGILVLDEPTAALDPLAEEDIYQKYEEMAAGKTSVFISHRLASTRFCDRIIFLENGRILEEGTHEGLRQKGGAYAKLFEVQSRYYQEDAIA